jgi:hypothetical protein
MLTLFEELFLLSIHEEKGTVVSIIAENLGYGLNGAVLAELALGGKIRVGENRRVELVDPASSGDEILDKALAQIRASENPRKVSFWIRFFNDQPKKFRRSLGERLVEKGILTLEETHWSAVIPFDGSPDSNISARFWVKSRLRKLALTSAEPDLRDVALLSLALASGMTFLIFTRDERRTAHRRVYELMINSALSNPIAQTLEEIEDAVKSLAGSD